MYKVKSLNPDRTQEFHAFNCENVYHKFWMQVGWTFFFFLLLPLFWEKRDSIILSVPCKAASTVGCNLVNVFSIGWFYLFNQFSFKCHLLKKKILPSVSFAHLYFLMPFHQGSPGDFNPNP